MAKRYSLLLSIILLFLGCKKADDNIQNQITTNSDLTIFIVNDIHGQLHNFPKIKQIVDKERLSKRVILCCGGDIFSGNPVVDNYEDKGYPIIDVMNQCGFNISVVGNHEFDYGEDILKERMEQANFDWVCANVDMGNSLVPEPYEYNTLIIDSLRVTFLGLIETNGMMEATIPSTHPFRVQNFTFDRPENVVAQYSNVKGNENADLYIALTHLGHGYHQYSMGDYDLAEDFPYFDLIIGGHSHAALYDSIYGIPVFQAGSYLNYLGKIKLTIKNKRIYNYSYDLIDLNNYQNVDAELQSLINQYDENISVVLDEVIGFSHTFHKKYQIGCFYTDALRERLDADVCFQNTGGIRTSLNQGDITVREIYEIDPFNNNALKYEMSVADIKSFLKGSGAGFYYSGVQIEQNQNSVVIRDLSNNILDDSIILDIGINDYIPAVYPSFFPEAVEIQDYTTAQALIYYLQNMNDQVNYTDCDNYFRFQ